MLNPGARRGERAPRRVCVYDCRRPGGAEEAGVGKWFETRGLDFNEFLQSLHQAFEIGLHETFVLTTTDRTVMDFDKFEALQHGSTLHLLQKEDQALSAATMEHINFVPHYDTLIRCGMYEYYASEGQNSLPYALAELVDNALSATAKNTGARTIEIRMMFDETLGKPAVIVLDNGCGMTSKQLNNWAVYRLSKFSREDTTFPSEQQGHVRPDPVRRSLNSDISYFGVGGKQATFYIGNSARMITKPVSIPDVHELVLSKEEFERKAKNKEDIYSGIIRNRKPGDSSHVNKSETFLHSLIAEEPGKESFTAVVITGVEPEHMTFLTQHFESWTRQLAHVYHYYLHGGDGNDLKKSSTNSDHLPNIDIQVTLRNKPHRCPSVMNLREVENDMQTLYINTAADTFDFKAFPEQDSGMVEGVIRYHPFLYDKETYPKDPNAVQATCDDNDVNHDDDDDDDSGVHEAGEKRPIFNCFWNGRLIPFTTVSEFDWCKWSKESKVPKECYSRISGVLFTDDRFQVTTNKLTFLNLEAKLKDRNTIFTRIVNGQKQRGNIKKEFTQWLQSCHQKWDKQIQFRGYTKTITRTDLTKKMQHPWATFSSIEWDRKIYRSDQLVKTQKTNPILYGKVKQFLLHGDYKGDIFATGGYVEISLEPKALHDKTKIILISKIDQTASLEAIQTHINSEFAKLPEKLTIDWPECNPWPQNAVRAVGTPLGPLRVHILNKKEESLSRMPTVGQGPVRKLVVELKVIHHGAKGDQEVISCIAPHASKEWAFWFKKMSNLTDLGSYTLYLNTMISETSATIFGGRALPSYKLNFTIKEGNAECFITGAMSSPARVGVPFDIPLLIKDGYDHPTAPPPNVKPVLKCSGLDLSYEKVDSSETKLTIRSVRASGKVLNYQQSEPYNLKVTLPGIKKHTQGINIVLLPGKAHSLHVKPEDDPITAENGNPLRFDVEIHDEAGNITACPKQIVRCQVDGLLVGAADCSNRGTGQIVTKPIDLKIVKGQPQRLKVQFEMPNQKNIASVLRELMVLPSTRVSCMELCSVNDENLLLKNNEKIEWLAGGVLENLIYRLYDEACREVPLTAEIASKIKVNWTPDLDLADLIQGKLPDVHVPEQVKEQRFYQVSYQDQSASVSFTIVPRPDEPARLKATLTQNTVKLGEILPVDIYLELVDKYDNATGTLTRTCVNDISVEAKGLDMSAITFMWQENSSSVRVTGVQFLAGTPGSREMSFTYKSYIAQIIVQVAPGVPEQLKLVSGPEKPLQVLNEHGIAVPFVIQLCDKWGNPSPDKRVVVELKSSSPTLTLKTAVTSQPVNTEGKASFTVNTVIGPKGSYQLAFKGFFNLKPIPGPSVNLTVIPDPNKPVNLAVDYDANARFPAGGKFPVFSVTVVSDEGCPMTNFNPAAASMFVWQEGAAAAARPPSVATELKCSKPMENEKTECFYFRDKMIPESVGRHIIQFSLLVDQAKVIYSHQITVNVVANQPVKLSPDSLPPTPVVSYSKVIASRTLVENMILRIRDTFGNPAGLDLNGKVNVSIKNLGGDNNKNLPLFEGRTNSVQFSLVKGKAHINRLAVMENSPGQDSSSYTLVFKPVLMVSTHLASFELLFHFYNDVENQRKMSELTAKKDELTKVVNEYKDFFTQSSELLQMLNSQFQDASKKETEQRNVLNMRNMNITQSVSVPDIDILITEKTARANRFLNMPRRVCSIPENFSWQQDVVGKVGHLAFLQDDDAARVISWHIRGDMDCVVTRTTAAAKRICNNSQGKQEVMPLDLVCVSTENRPLPHIRNGRVLFEPPGNPVYARDLLIYPKHHESCSKVFKNILGDTILIDDLDSATSYRQSVVQNNAWCPTILTRQGNRVSAKGKFGGAQNIAPAIHQLQVFGAPLPKEYYILKEQIGLLSQYRSTLQKKVDAEKEQDDHIAKSKSPETLQKEQKMKEKEKQLEEIKKQCVLLQVRPAKRGLDVADHPSGIIAKRAKERSTEEMH